MYGEGVAVAVEVYEGILVVFRIATGRLDACKCILVGSIEYDSVWVGSTLVLYIVESLAILEESLFGSCVCGCNLCCTISCAPCERTCCLVNSDDVCAVALVCECTIACVESLCWSNACRLAYWSFAASECDGGSINVAAEGCFCFSLCRSTCCFELHLRDIVGSGCCCEDEFATCYLCCSRYVYRNVIPLTFGYFCCSDALNVYCLSCTNLVGNSQFCTIFTSCCLYGKLGCCFCHCWACDRSVFLQLYARFSCIGLFCNCASFCPVAWQTI